jgi:tetratricopeptide (TPR) repeat protein
MGNPEMTPEVMAGLVQHSYNEGAAAYHAGQAGQAMVWFAQCLDTLRSLGDNEEMASALLFYAGAIYAGAGQSAQAAAFMEAVANLQQRQGPDQPTAQTLETVGGILAEIGYPAVACRVLGAALVMDEKLGLGESGRKTRQALQRLVVQPAAACSHEFTIRIGQQAVSRFSVTADGQLAWSDWHGDVGAVPMGLAAPWNAICTDSRG